MITTAPPPLRALLTGIVDYAGLFPPAGLDMATAVRNYAEYHAGADRWMLGRFVVPIARLPEFDGELEAFGDNSPGLLLPDAWPLSVLGGPEAGADAALLEAFIAGRPDVGVAAGVVVEAVEVRVAAPAEVASMVAPYRQLEAALDVYVEIPLTEEPARFVAAIAAARGRAKARAGGVTPESIPPAAQLLRFLDTCLRAGVPCKATAGLHHPLRASYRLTYEAGSAHAEMHGYLNVFLAAAVLRGGGSMTDAEAVMLERDAAAFVVTTDAIRWRAWTFDVRSLEDTRAMVAGFGSCSFREPVDDLRALALL